jgi:regulator of sigma E protease
MTDSVAARPVTSRRPVRLVIGRPRRQRAAVAVAIALTGIAVALVIRHPVGGLELLRNAVVVLGIITLVVGFHELSHLVTARILGIAATTYAIGFGPVLVSRTKFGVSWQIRALPLGGFVALRGERDDDGPGSFVRAAAWRRILVLLAGPLSNIVLAAVLLTVLLMVITGADAVRSFQGGVQLLAEIVRLTVAAVAAWVPNAFAAPMDAPIVGLPGMVTQTTQLLDMGPWMVFVLAAAFSCSAGLLNILPIPPLDGGQALLVAVRAIGRGHVDEAFLGRLQVAGLRVLLVFSGGITVLDMVRVLAQYRN